MNSQLTEFAPYFDTDRVMTAAERNSWILSLTQKATEAGYLDEDWQAVIKITDALAQLGELDRHCRLLRAKGLIELGQFHDAIADLIDLAAKDPWCGNTQNLLGEARLYVKKYKEAIRAFSNCICLKPITSIMRSESSSYIGRAIAFSLMGRAQAAAADMDMCVSMRQIQKARRHYWSGSYDECTRILKSLPSRLRMLPSGQYLNARNLTAAGNYSAALNDISKALSSSHVSLPLLYCRAVCNFKTENFEACIVDLSKIINLAGRIVLLEVNPIACQVELVDLSEIINMRAICYKQVGNYSAAIEDYEKVVDLKPSANTYFDRAQMFYRLGLVVRALADLDKAECELADDTDFLSLKMLCFSRLNRGIEAAELAQSIIKKHPENDLAIKTLRLVEQPDLFVASTAAAYSLP